jgi:hypothetical protein
MGADASPGRDALARAARERLRAELEAEARVLAADEADRAVIADVQAFISKLGPEQNRS